MNQERRVIFECDYRFDPNKEHGEQDALGSTRFLAALVDEAIPSASPVAHDESYLHHLFQIAAACNQLTLDNLGTIRIHFLPERRAFSFIMTFSSLDVLHSQFDRFAAFKHLSLLRLLAEKNELVLYLVYPLFPFRDDSYLCGFEEDFTPQGI